MSIETTVKLSKSCEFVLGQYASSGAYVSLDYTEHSSDAYHSDNETSIDIDKDMAIAIISMLQKAYNLEGK